MTRPMLLTVIGLTLAMALQAPGQVFPGNPDLLTKSDLTVDGVFASLPNYKLGDDRVPLEFLAAKIAEAAKRPDSPEARALAKRLAGLLEVPATYECKDFVLRQLLVIGGHEQVQEIYKWNDDPEIGCLCIAVLEQMNDPSADAILREEIPLYGKDARLMGLNALGNHHDVKIVSFVKDLLCECEPETAAAALATLGQIASDEARRFIESRKFAEMPLIRTAADRAMLRVAYDLLDRGRNDEAGGIMENLYNDKGAPQAVREAALRGYALARPARAMHYIVQNLKGDDWRWRQAALSAMRDIPADASTAPIAEAVGELAPGVQARVLGMFAIRHDRAGRAAAGEALKSSEAAVREAAVRSLASIGSAGDVPMLLGLAAGNSPDREAAREALETMQGKDVDAAVLAAEKSGDASIGAEAVRTAEKRGIMPAGASSGR